MRTMLIVAVLTAISFHLVSCQSAQPTQQCQSCTDSKAKNGWCDGCKVGFKPDGTTTKCKMCHTGITGKNVWCDGCNKGYVNGKGVKCKGCFTQSTGGTKCPTCSK